MGLMVVLAGKFGFNLFSVSNFFIILSWLTLIRRRGGDARGFGESIVQPNLM
jgi:hypothetical protein